MNEVLTTTQRNEVLYYEIHVTVDPLFGIKLETFKRVCNHHRFRVAELIMKKGRDDAGTPSQEDSFCTGRRQTMADATEACSDLMRGLYVVGIRPRRYKIEATLIDVRIPQSSYDDPIVSAMQQDMIDKENEAR